MVIWCVVFVVRFDNWCVFCDEGGFGEGLGVGRLVINFSKG